MLIVKAHVAQRIREAREYREITQVEMAQHLDVARQTYLDIESGKTEPKISSLAVIADVTGRPLNWLLYGESTRSDIAFTHRDELNTLLMLFNKLPLSARHLVMEQALLLAAYMVDIGSSPNNE
ncbi:MULTISPECIES: helix-turn-helix domain-containing protein [Enterovibrio]|uniref:Helix-turn-helix domain-containing protein n=2 Tax=Enterovibrio norvegicus TaxID=188144 RepID=A0A2N7LF13_9GAMM|nr:MULTISPECIES: helix-turn-helix transcriptional regulator [Enterovibrio]MBE1277475.1 XRE family transcriptional regulator [Enterovibrio baiacu]MCC4800490.1 helix-turn-helix domain-containing protein [Enterovibrio norvegicus]OEE44047.1 transcriptional regulator [Enterovibrio norvegicus]OEF48297.1 transcriptional regulator [Enterovibrio norvegicus]OEF54426.1 transcriptional regulator [Enterovibrio norvegicus]